MLYHASIEDFYFATEVLVRMRMGIRRGVWLFCPALLLLLPLGYAQRPTPVGVELNEQAVAGRPVLLDGEGKLLPFPMGDNTGYS